MGDDIQAAAAAVASMRARSVLEQQRIMALYSGNFYREILPHMYDASIIDQKRFLDLMNCSHVESVITMHEMLDLAVAWGITPSAREFWKRYKSRDDLVGCLQRKKAEMDLAAKAEEHAPAYSTTASGGAPKSRAQTAERGFPAVGEAGGPRMGRRRSSVAISLQSALGSAFANIKPSKDLFSTQGDYADGIIYRARRMRMDAESLAEYRSRLAGYSAYAQFARNRARMRSSSQDETDDFFDDWSGSSESPPDSPRRGTMSPMRKPGAISEDSSSSSMPSFPPLVMGPPATTQIGPHGVVRLGPSETQDASRDSGSGVRFSPQTKPDVPLLRRANSSRANPFMRAASKRNVRSRELVINSTPHLMDMDAFVSKYSRDEDEDVIMAAQRSSRSLTSIDAPFTPRSPFLGAIMPTVPNGIAMPALSSMEESKMDNHAGMALLHKLSKLDLYYRPVQDTDKMVVVIPSQGAREVSPRPTDLFLSIAVDRYVDSPKSSGRSVSRAVAMSTASPVAADTPSPLRTEPLAMRHRVGGRAGALARNMSDKLRAELPTVDFRLTSTPTAERPPSRTPGDGTTSLPKIGKPSPNLTSPVLPLSPLRF